MRRHKEINDPDPFETKFDRREDVRDRRKNVRERNEDRRDRPKNVIERKYNSGLRARRVDVPDKKEVE